MDRAFTLPNGRARAFLGRVLATEEHELDCGEVLEVIARHVDGRVAGQDPTDDLAGVPPHLRQCADCAEMVATLQYLAELEAEGELPDLDHLWSELRSATPEPATAARSAGAPAARARPAIRRLERVLLPLAAAAVILVSFVWWRADRDRSRAYAKAQHAEEMMETIATADEVRFLRREDGSWLRLLWSPTRESAVLVVGDLAAVGTNDRITCWLKGRDGTPVLAAAFDRIEPKMDWWLIEADRPIGDYTALEMMVEPEGRELFQVALGPPSGVEP